MYSFTKEFEVFDLEVRSWFFVCLHKLLITFCVWKTVGFFAHFGVNLVN